MPTTCFVLARIFPLGKPMAMRDAAALPLRLGYEYGSKKFPDMARSCVSNLPAILNLRYGWGLEDPAVWSIGR